MDSVLLHHAGAQGGEDTLAAAPQLSEAHGEVLAWLLLRAGISRRRKRRLVSETLQSKPENQSHGRRRAARALRELFRHRRLARDTPDPRRLEGTAHRVSEQGVSRLWQAEVPTSGIQA